jgi:hypothetical protein
MKTITFTLLLVFSLCTSYSQGIFDASIHTAVPFGDVNSPATETAQQVIDQDPMTKFLDFNIEDGMGFEVDLGMGNAEIATSMAFVTANDAPERDPTNYEIFGSNDGMAYTSIATGMIPCVSDRFLGRIFTIPNSTAYSIYRINFTGTCNTSTIIQVADVQLFTTTGNAPTITCPDDFTVSTTAGQCSGSAEYTVTVTDVEDGSITPTLILGGASGDDFPLGISPVVYSVADSDGNGVSCEFFITVEDTEAPTLVCPSDQTVGVSPGQTSAEVDFDVLATDNCSVTNIIPEFTALGTIDGNSYYVSDSLYTPEDANVDAFENQGVVGTIRSQSDNDYIHNAISVYINEPISVLIGYSDILYEGSWIWASGDGSTYTNWNEGEPNNSGPDGAPENYVVLLNSGLWNDVTGDPFVYRYLLEREFELEQTAGLESGSDFPLGTTTNTFTVSDVAGNVSTCSFDITVDESTSVENHELANGLKILPNPSRNGQVSISNESNILIEKVLFYNVYGKLVHVEKVNLLNGVGTIDINNLSSGVYLLEMHSQYGATSKKLIKAN